MLKFYNVPQNDETEISEFPKLILARDVEKEGFPSQFSCCMGLCAGKWEKYRGGGGVPCEIQMAYFSYLTTQGYIPFDSNCCRITLERVWKTRWVSSKRNSMLSMSTTRIIFKNYWLFILYWDFITLHYIIRGQHMRFYQTL